MTTASWLAASQTLLFLAVCGFAWWAARLIAEAANSSAQAAERAIRAADDAERTAADIREMRDRLGTWLDQHQARLARLDEQQRQDAASCNGSVRTDTAEARAVITPQAITDHASGTDSADGSVGDGARSRGGRHARDTDPRWTAALRAVAARISSTDA